MIDEWYFNQPDSDIVAEIRSLSVPKHILQDGDNWPFLCAVWGRNMEEITVEKWEKLCRARSRVNNW